MNIGIDIFGGDFAPEAVVEGCILARKELSEDVNLVLIGSKEDIDRICKKNNFISSGFTIVHTSEYIEMGEHPAKTFAKKQNSSIVIGYELLKSKKLNAFASAGNTGAMLVGAMQVIKSIPGVIRPCITITVPRINGLPALLLDVGINPDCKPDILYQYGILGSLYMKYIYKIENPKVGLINIGSEEEKGNLVTKSTYQLMKDNNDFNFIGNIEGSDFFNENVDVMICDGFVGNVMLKQVEAFYAAIKKRKINDEFFDKFNFENYGGTPILGINGNVVIGHGISNDVAIKNMILYTVEIVKADLPKKITKVFNYENDESGNNRN